MTKDMKSCLLKKNDMNLSEWYQEYDNYMTSGLVFGSDCVT